MEWVSEVWFWALASEVPGWLAGSVGTLFLALAGGMARAGWKQFWKPRPLTEQERLYHQLLTELAASYAWIQVTDGIERPSSSTSGHAVHVRLLSGQTVGVGGTPVQSHLSRRQLRNIIRAANRDRKSVV